MMVTSGLQAPRRGDDLLVGARLVEGDDQGARRLEAAAAQEILARGVAVIDRLAGAPLARGQIRIDVDGDEADAVRLEHFADQRRRPARSRR